MDITLGEILSWAIVGALVGPLVAWLVTRKREGFGRLTNFGLGLVGALVGGVLFEVFGIDLGSSVQLSLRDVIAALVGTFLFYLIWRVLKKKKTKKGEAKAA